MANAIKIETLDSSLAVQGTLNFARYEAAAGSASGRFRISEQVSQNGQPTIFLLMNNTNPYKIIPVTFRIHGASTIGKLVTIRDHLIAAAGNLVRLYPKLVSDASLFYDCFVDPASIPEESFFSGENMADERITLEFREVDKTAQSIVLGDVIIE